MDVEMLKGARTQRFLNCALVSCMTVLDYLYILCLSRPQSVTHCGLAFLILPVSEPPRSPPMFGPCGPVSAGQTPRWDRKPLPPPRDRVRAHSAGNYFFFCKLTKPPRLRCPTEILPFREGQAEPLSDVVGRRKSGLTPAPTQIQNHFMKGEIT